MKFPTFKVIQNGPFSRGHSERGNTSEFERLTQLCLIMIALGGGHWMSMNPPEINGHVKHHQQSSIPGISPPEV